METPSFMENSTTYDMRTSTERRLMSTDWLSVETPSGGRGKPLIIEGGLPMYSDDETTLPTPHPKLRIARLADACEKVAYAYKRD